MTLLDTSTREYREVVDCLISAFLRCSDYCPPRWSYDCTTQEVRDIIDTDLLTMANGGTPRVTFTELSNRMTQ